MDVVCCGPCVPITKDGTVDGDVPSATGADCLSAVIFRERLLVLADEYARMEAVLSTIRRTTASSTFGQKHHFDASMSDKIRRHQLHGPDDEPGVCWIPESVSLTTRLRNESGGKASSDGPSVRDGFREQSLSKAASGGVVLGEGLKDQALSVIPTRSSLRLAKQQTEATDIPSLHPIAERQPSVGEEPMSMQPSSPSRADRGCRPSKTKKLLRTSTPDHLTMRRNPLLYIAHSRSFLRFIGFTILLNVAFMGCIAELGMHDVKAGTDANSYAALEGWVEVCFIAVYSIELAIRVRVFGWHFFRDPEERAWNIFDMALVVQGSIEACSFLLGPGKTNGTNLSFLRAMRFMKVLKALRVLRLMRSMRELRMIIVLVLGSLRSMVWSLIMLGVACYVFSLIIVQGVVVAFSEEADISQDWVQEVLDFWGSIDTAMLTLFMATSGGIDWRDAMFALKRVGFIFPVILMLYIAWFMFVMLNVITAVVVESTLSFGGRDYEHNIQSQMEKKEEYEDSLRMLFEEMDVSGDGEVSFEEFIAKIENPELVAFFSSLDIEIGDAHHFFYMLSEYGTKSVTLSQFVSGCIRMRGQAQALDLNDVRNKQVRMQRAVDAMSSRLEEQSEFTRAVIERLEATTSGLSQSSCDDTCVESKKLPDLVPKIAYEL